MALKISKNAGLTDVVTDASVLPYLDTAAGNAPTSTPSATTISNPAYNGVTTTHPTTGSASAAVQLWLFNNDVTKTYQSINIDPTDAVTTDESTWVQLAPDSGGSAGTFGAAGAALSMANVTDNGVGKPFWYKCTTPSGQSVSNKTDIKLTVNYTEYPA